MGARIVSIGTAVPATRIRQESVRDFFASQPGVDRLTRRLINASFDSACIEQRHTVLAQFDESYATSGDDVCFITPHRSLANPSTAARNRAYISFAPPLSAAAARMALTDADLDPSLVTHVVTVSCTGFFAPGPDYRLVRDLGLAPTVQRDNLGFVGCAAAIPALRLAARITATEPSAVVLVVCTELCSLHIRASSDRQQIVAASVFADGAAAALVAGEDAAAGRTGLDLDRFATTLTSEGEHDMVWTIGDDGFKMVLTGEVPRIIGREIRSAVDSFLGDHRPDVWAVHPGGRSVLDRVESGLELAPCALDASRTVLRQYGNMSSATVLFILRRLLQDESIGDGARIAGLAFGPGLTVESALLTKREAVPG
ncbi:MAG: type III polyketide synthase [Brooklawnia sp.]|uniref:type III polyketide synthase n=1 Tax=Brooklawnia sp. TaxID=2699740 RepID=UPI003C708C58